MSTKNDDHKNKLLKTREFLHLVQKINKMDVRKD